MVRVMVRFVVSVLVFWSFFSFRVLFIFMWYIYYIIQSWVSQGQGNVIQGQYDLKYGVVLRFSLRIFSWFVQLDYFLVNKKNGWMDCFYKGIIVKC